MNNNNNVNPSELLVDTVSILLFLGKTNQKNSDRYMRLSLIDLLDVSSHGTDQVDSIYRDLVHWLLDIDMAVDNIEILAKKIGVDLNFLQDIRSCLSKESLEKIWITIKQKKPNRINGDIKVMESLLWLIKTIMGDGYEWNFVECNVFKPPVKFLPASLKEASFTEALETMQHKACEKHADEEDYIMWILSYWDKVPIRTEDMDIPIISYTTDGVLTCVFKEPKQIFEEETVIVDLTKDSIEKSSETTSIKLGFSHPNFPKKRSSSCDDNIPPAKKQKTVPFAYPLTTTYHDKGKQRLLKPLEDMLWASGASTPIFFRAFFTDDADKILMVMFPYNPNCTVKTNIIRVSGFWAAKLTIRICIPPVMSNFVNGLGYKLEPHITEEVFHIPILNKGMIERRVAHGMEIIIFDSRDMSEQYFS